MLLVLSPAKRLDFDSHVATASHSIPQLLDESASLMDTAKTLDASDIQALMKLSPALAELNYDRFQVMGTSLDTTNARQAILAFKGDVYRGLAAETFTDADLAFAQEHMGILSGLYGYLRPLDLMQPYRLEMGTKFANARGKDLYAFWGERITQALLAQLASHQDNTLVNLASNEYFKSVKVKQLPGRIITPVFKDTKDGKSRVLFAYAKPARGMMARFIIQQRIDRPEGLKDFDLGGYAYRSDLSEGDTWVFERPQPEVKGRR